MNTYEYVDPKTGKLTTKQAPDEKTALQGTGQSGVRLVTPTTSTPTQPPQNLQQANQLINSTQQTDFATASKVDEPQTRRSFTDIAKEVTSVLGSNLPNKVDNISFTDTYKQLKADSGLVELENNLNSLQAQARDIQAQRQARINAEKGKAVPMNVIAGRVGEVEQQENERLMAIENSIQTATAQYKTKLDTVDTIMKYTAMDYDNAVQNYDRQFSQNIQVMNMVKSISDDEKSDEERVIDNARANAQIMINTMQSNGTTYDDLTPDQQVNLTKLGLQSGLGANFFADVMNVSAGKEILTTITSDDKTKTTIMYKDGTTKVISTGLSPTPKGTTTGGTTTSGGLTLSKNQLQQLTSTLEQYRGADGYIDAGVYQEAYRDWLKSGGLATDFIKKFDPKMYVNPANTELPVYLRNPAKTTTTTERSL